MKPFFAHLCALLWVLCVALAPISAQEAEVPRPLGFIFKYELSTKTPVPAFNIGYQWTSKGAKPVVFESTITGDKGLIVSETLSFINEAGQVLGTLSSSFDASGRLQGQILVEGTQPPRALNWFETGAQSSELSVEGSIIVVRYSLNNGFLKERVLTVKTAAKARSIVTSYNAQGRRENDVGEGDSGKTRVRLLYDEQGVSGMRGGEVGEEKEKFEFDVTHRPDGQIDRIFIKNGGILRSRTTNIFDETGKNTGMRSETFKDEVLASVVETGVKKKVEETYNKGVLASRQTEITAEGGEKSLSTEQFDADGKRTVRLDYGEGGTITLVTFYNPDGSIKAQRDMAAQPAEK